jgi:hypothetical protein
MLFVNLMNIDINNKNNSRYLILLFMVSVFSAIVFLASHENIQQSVFANPQDTMKDQMNNMTGMQNPNMMMDQSQMQKLMMEQMNKTGMMMGSMMGMEPMMMDQSQMQKLMMEQMNKTGMMMGMKQGMMMPCMMMGPMMIGNHTTMGVMPCITMMDPTQMQKMMMEHMKDPKHMQLMMEQMNKTGMMMEKNKN